MDRREAIKQASIFMGFAVSGTAMTAILNGCTPSGRADWNPVFLSPGESRLVSELAETILPATDTPGAIEVGVPEFIDTLLAECYEPEDQQIFKQGLADLDSRSTETFGKPFLELPGDDRVALANTLKDEVIGHVEARQRTDEEKGEPKPFFATMLELTVLGYLTSEEVGERVLAYDPIPMEYLGCMDMQAGQRSWAL